LKKAKCGFIAAPTYRRIMNDQGEVAWDMDNWKFLLSGKDFNSIHPSRQRQATLNMEYGLYEVVTGIYQVWLRSGQHHFHQGQYRLDRHRSPHGEGDLARGPQVRQ
jgi:alkyl sulfatase BDS1-like metallo-beta-lactamase superfamily hydrolase